MIATNAAYGPLLNPPVDVQALTEFQAVLASIAKRLSDLLPLADCDQALQEIVAAPQIELTVKALEIALAGIPEPSKQDASRDFLSVAQERLEAFRDASLRLKAAKERAATAARVFEIYGETTVRASEAIYEQVEAKFTDLYRLINHDDESEFTAQLKPSIGKLGFDVNFYGRGHFPPGAYHSEGHQDGMGLCLYLALMHHLLGPAFTFAVLDDVLMSVETRPC